MESGVELLEITKKLSTFGWRIEGAIASSVFAKLKDNDGILYRYIIDILNRNATYELWKDGKRIGQSDIKYDAVLKKALRNKI